MAMTQRLIGKNIVVRSEQDEIDSKTLSELVSRLLAVNLKLTGQRLHADTSSLDGLILGVEQVARSVAKGVASQKQ